jgi:hypothetical protein
VEQLLAHARSLPVQTAELRTTVEEAEAALALQARTKAAAAKAAAEAQAAAAAASAAASAAAAAAAAAAAKAMADAQHDAAAAIAVQPAAVADPADADTSDADTSDADTSDADTSDAEWVSTPAGNSALACLPLSERVQRLQLGTLLIKVTATECPLSAALGTRAAGAARHVFRQGKTRVSSRGPRGGLWGAAPACTCSPRRRTPLFTGDLEESWEAVQASVCEAIQRL